MGSMRKWEIQLKTYNALAKELLEKRKKGESGLRFNRPSILASDIAEQYFCEKKVEMHYLHGEVETEEKNIGTGAHEKLLEGAMKTNRRELWQKIYDKKPVFALEMLLLAKYRGLILAGRPDSVLFQKGYPLIVFEYKFSRSDIAYLAHHVQARTYGVLLRNMGFDTSRLFYAIVIADPEAKNDTELKRRVIDAIVKNGPKESALKIEHAGIHFHKFSYEDAEKDLDWAVEFWMNSREAKSTRNMNKCKNCEYRVECRRSTHRQLSSF